MSAECDALRRELERIRADIAALDSRFIPRPDRAQILADARELIVPLIGGIALGVVRPEISGLRGQINIIGSRASQALGISNNALSVGEQASLSAQIAKVQAAEGVAKATSAQTTGNLAKELADRAKMEASVAKTLGNRAAGLAAAAESKAAQAATKATTAFTKAATAVGISENALSTAGRALAGLGRLLGIINVILGILAALTFAAQIAQILRRLELIERVLNTAFAPIYSLLGINQAEIRRVRSTAEQAAGAASNAQNTANIADNRAGNAMSAESNAALLALNAFGLSTSLIFLRSLVPQVQTLAQTANTTAIRALTRTLTPGPRGLQGVQGIQGIRGQRGLTGVGLPGLQGPPGRNGFNGVNGKNGSQGAPGRQGLTGLMGLTGLRGARGANGINGVNGEDALIDPVLKAAILRTDATTQRNASILGFIFRQVDSTGLLLKKVWDTLQVDRVIQYASYAVGLHNAYYLSKNVGESVIWAVDATLQAVGLNPQNADGSAMNLNALVTSKIKNVLTALIGAERSAEIKAKLNNLNRIYQSGMNMVYLTSSMLDSARTVGEVTGSMVGRIGNALRKSGAVAENSYKWMPERLDRVHANQERWQSLFTKLETAEQATSNVAAISGEVLSVKQTVDELTKARADFSTQINSITSLSGDTADYTVQAPTVESPDATATVTVPDIQHDGLEGVWPDVKIDSEAPVNLTDAAVGLTDG